MFLAIPAPKGYGFSAFGIAGAYGTPIVRLDAFSHCKIANIRKQVAVFLGELIGRFGNDAIMNICIRRNNGVFESESRLW